MRRKLKVISLVLLSSILFNILPLGWMQNFFPIQQAKADTNLTREDFKKFEGSISAGGNYDGSQTVMLQNDGTVTCVGYNNDGECNVDNWRNIVAVSTSFTHTVGLKSDGTVVAVGDNGAGQLNVSDWKDIVAVSAGAAFTVGLKKDGTVVATGNNYYGQINVSDWKDITSISAGFYQTVGLKKDGTVVATGNSGHGENNVSGWQDIVAISAGYLETVGLKSDGTVVAVGNNDSGQLNVGDWNNIVSVSAGYYETVGLKSDGTVVAIGSNQYGQTNVSDWNDIVAVAAGRDQTIGLKSDGTYVAVGYNLRGQTNVSSWDNYNAVSSGTDQVAGLRSDGTVKVVGANGEINVSDWNDINKIVTGNSETFGIKKDGTVVVVGNNYYGETNVSSWSNIISIASNWSHTVGLRSDGTVVGAGYNQYGQLNVYNWSDIVAIATGNSHTVGLKRDGTVVAVGTNYNGEANVSSWKDIVAIAAGNSFTLGLKKDGTVVSTGVEGNGSTKISDWKDIVQISAGNYNASGLKKDGTVVALGYGFKEPDVSSWKNITSISSGPISVIGKKSDGTFFDSSHMFYSTKPQLSVNKNIVKPGEDLEVLLSKNKTNKFYQVNNLGISLNGGITATGEMDPVNDMDYEYTYKVQPTESGSVDISFPGITDQFGNNLQESDFFRVIPLQSIKSSKTTTSSGDRVTLTATFYKSVNPGFKIALDGAVDLSPTTMTEVSGSNRTKYILTYTVPYGYKDGAINASLQNVETADGQKFSNYTEENVFTKQNRLAPVSSLTASTNKAKIGDVVTVTVNFSESIKNGVQLSFDGAGEMDPVVMNETPGSNGTQYTYNYTVPEGFTGSLNAHLKEVYDLNNKLSQEYISNNLFDVDGNRANISSLTASTASAKLGDKVLLTVVFDEPVKPDFTLSLTNGVNLENVSMNEVVGSNSTQFTYEYVVKEGDFGSVQATIDQVEDLAGNTSPKFNKEDVFQADGINPAIVSIESEEKEYTVGDYAHIIATFTEPIKPGVKLKLSGGIDNEEYVMTEVPGSNGTQYEIYYEIKEGQHGVVYGLLSNIVDLAGNEVTYDQKRIFYASDPSNANLDNITVTDGNNTYPLTPEFSSDIDTYSINLPSNVTSIFLSGETQDSKATLAGGGLKNLVQGDNSFVLTVTAGNLNTKYYKVNIHVADNTPPVITGAVDQTINMDTTFDAMDGVKAVDNVDGDLTSILKVDGSVDTNTPGVYVLTYSVIDKAGNLTTVNRSITVVDNIPPAMPIVNPVGDNQNSITGTSEENANVFAEINGTTIGSGQVQPGGSFSISIDKQPAGTKINVYAVDASGNKGEAATIEVQDFTAPQKPEVNAVTDKGTIITGQAEPSAIIEVKRNDTVIGSGTTGEDGSFTVSIPVQTAGTKLEITAADKAGNVSEPTLIVVKDVTAPEKPVVNEVTDKDTSVTGQAEAGSKVEVSANGMVIGSGTTEFDSKFTINIPVQKAGVQLVITATDDAGNISDSQTMVVKDVTAPDKPKVNEVTDKDTSVTGQAEPGSNVGVKVNGAVIGSGTSGIDGKFSITIPMQKAGTQLVITATDDAGNISDSQTIVIKDETAPDKPTVNEVTDKDTSVTGQAEEGSRVEVSVNGLVIGSETTGIDGKFSISIPVQKAGTQLVITATDDAGNISDSQTIVIKDVTAPDKPIVNEVTEKDNSVTGQAESGSNVEVKVNGKVIGSGTTGTDGLFSITIPVQKAGTQLVIIATDDAGNVSDSQTIVVKDVTAPDKPIVNEVTDKDTSVTGQSEPGSNVEVKVNGAVIGSGTTETDGKFSITIPVQKAGTQLVITATDDAGNVSDSQTIVVKDVTAPDKPIVNEVTDKDTSVTGQAEEGSRVEISVDGLVIGSGTTGTDGKFSITIPVQKAGTQLVITATDDAGNISDSQTIVIKDVTAPDKPIVNEVTDKDTSVTGQAEPGSNVEVEVKVNGEVIGSGTTDPDGKFSITIPVQKAGIQLVITATDDAGNVSDSQTIVIKDVTAPDKPVVNEVTDKDTSVTGQAEPGSNVEVKVNGEVIGSGTTDSDGKFSITIPVQKAGIQLVITATDDAGNISDSQTILVKDVTAPDRPTVNEVSDKDTSVTGQAEVGSIVEVKVNGTVIGSGTTGTDGKFSIIIPVQKAGVQLVIIATDSAGNESAPLTIVVKDKTSPDKPLVNQISDKDTYVKGQTEAGSKVEVKVNGMVIGSGIAETDGKFSVKISVQKAGTKLSITSTDKAGNISLAAVVTVIDKTAPLAPIVNSVTDQSKVIIGKTEANANVTILIGTKKYQTKADVKGIFNLSIPLQKAGTKISITATDIAGNVSIARTVIVIDKTPPSAPKVNTVKSITTIVTGKAEAYATITIKVGIKVIGTATADKNGNFKVKIKAQKKKTILSITATDKAKNISKATVIKVL